MGHWILNTHERVLAASCEQIEPLLPGLGGCDDVLWPSPRWHPMVLDGPLRSGASGGHGRIRYVVTEAEPRSVRFEFESIPGVNGYHRLTLEPTSGGETVMRHHLSAQINGPMSILWPVAVQHLHNAILEDLLDDAERAVTGNVASPARWSLWVRLLRVLTRVQARAVDVPPEAALLLRQYQAWRPGRGGFVAAQTTSRWPGHPTDPQLWANALFRDPPAWVRAAMGVREAIVEFVGISRASVETFGTRERNEAEVLLGEDADHLRFRASVLVADDAVTVSTVATPSNLRGRLYLLPVRLIHPTIVRAMLRRAHRRLARSAWLEAH